MLLGENSDHINDLFGIDVQYEVPRYQRRYVWDETNWSTLWEDILYQLSLEFDAEERGNFTGNIVTRPLKGRQLDRFEIIDGQQRLATFQIIFCVIRDLCQAQDPSGLAADAARHIVNPEYVVKENTSTQPDLTYKFIPAAYDKSAFQAIMGGTDGNAAARTSNLSHRFFEAYDYFERKIRTYVGENCDFDRIRRLLSSIKSDFSVIHISLSPSDQPEKIFESLNATGRMLSEFDYLRNNLFLRAGKLGADERNRLYKAYWHFEEDAQYWEVDTLDSFFQAFLMAKWGLNCFSEKNTKPFELYQKYQQKLTAEQGLEYEFQQLRDYAKSYRELHDEISQTTSELGCHIQFYDDLDLPCLDSFLLCVKHKFGDNFIKDVCAILESYLVRRLLCHVTMNDSSASVAKASYERIDAFFVKLIAEDEFSVQEFATFLAADAMWPDDLQVEEALKEADSKNADFISYIFGRLENWKKAQFRLYDAPLDLEGKAALLAEIQGNVAFVRQDDQKLQELKQTFNEIWAPPHYFTECPS